MLSSFCRTATCCDIHVVVVVSEIGSLRLLRWRKGQHHRYGLRTLDEQGTDIPGLVSATIRAGMETFPDTRILRKLGNSARRKDRQPQRSCD